jgi:hypothetical protein
MTKISSSVAVLATAFLLTASISSANAGWGTNGQYGNAPGQAQSAPAPAPAPAQTGGYGGGQTRPADTWTRPTTQTGGTYGGSQQTNTYPGRPQVQCVRAPCNVYLPQRPVHVERPVYVPQRPIYVERPVYVPQRPVYVPQRPVYERPVYNNGGVYGGAQTYPRPNHGTVYAPRPTNNGGVYGGSTSSRPAQTTSSWNTSGGYGGSR